METLRLKISGETKDHLGDEASLRMAANILRSGGLVAFPTETVYGLGANALDSRAVKRIFEAKQRPHWDPLICHASDLMMLRSLVLEWPDEAEALAKAFMPGPITLLLRKAPSIPDVCTAGREKVGLRIPAHPTARRLIELAGVPVAAPSANRFGHTSPTTAEHVLADLDGRIEAIVDAGPSDVGVESTVIDPTFPPTIYRPGGLSREQIESVLGPVRVAQRPIVDDAPPESLESPGLGIRHYAPRARVLLVESEEDLKSTVNHECKKAKVGALVPAGWDYASHKDRVSIFAWGPIEDTVTLARNLYLGLRTLDKLGVEVIVVPLPAPRGLGLAIRDRLEKAAWNKKK